MIISPTKAAELISKGEVVGVPTDTVYGLAAHYRKPRAIENLFKLKKRPLNNPMVIQLSKLDDLLPFIPFLPDSCEDIIRKFWPGALTVVLPIHQHEVPLSIRAGWPNAAFRIPDHPITLEIISKAGPIVVPSANLSGETPATTAEEVEAAFGRDFPVVDGGPTPGNIPSTLIAYEVGKWKLLRNGAIPPEEIEAFTPLDK